MAAVSFSKPFPSLVELADAAIVPPQSVNKAVAAIFARLSEAPVFRIGSAFSKLQIKEEDYKFGDLSIRDLLAHRFETADNLSLMDIGCGSGAILASFATTFEESLTIMGVDAKRSEKLTDDQYAYGDAQRLAQIEKLKDKTFDVIVSRATFRHFVDPLKALKEAYKKLAPGGELIIDYLIFPGIQDSEQQILAKLQKDGYQVSAEALPGRASFVNFRIMKTKDNLALPFTYDFKEPLLWGNAKYKSHLKEPS